MALLKSRYLRLQVKDDRKKEVKGTKKKSNTSRTINSTWAFSLTSTKKKGRIRRKCTSKWEKDEEKKEEK